MKGELSGVRREVQEKLNKDMGFFYSVNARLAEEQTPYQKIEVLQTAALGKVLLLDGITQISERWEYRYHEPLVHPALLSHPRPRQVLLIGGGDGGALREILVHKTVEQVDLVELDEAVVRLARKELPFLHSGAFDDPRVRILFCDGRSFVESANPVYDAVIMDMTDPAGASRNLYTREFFQAVSGVMRGPEAVFSMHSESPLTTPAFFACIGQTLKTVFSIVCTSSTFVPMYGTLWSFRYASAISNPAILASREITQRIRERMVIIPLLANGMLWTSLFAPDPILTEADLCSRSRVITDEAPDFPVN